VSRGAVGSQSCHAASTRSAAFHGNAYSAFVKGMSTGTSSKVMAVITPKLPPPPPRVAQYRSWFSFSLARRSLPSAVMISTSSRPSHVSP